MFSLITYSVINLSCLLLESTGSVNFRPSFVYYSWTISLTGTFLSLFAMFYLDGAISLSIFLILSSIFVFVWYTSPLKNWGDVMQSILYHQVRKYLLKINDKNHVKFWRPQIILLVRNPIRNVLLMQFANDLKKGGLFVVCHVVTGAFNSCLVNYRKCVSALSKFVKVLDLKAFTNVSISINERVGAQNLLMGCGLGGLKPNILMMGFFNTLKSLDVESSDDDGQGITVTKWRQNRFSSFSTKRNVKEDQEISDIVGPEFDSDQKLSVSDWVGIIQGKII